MSVIQSPLTHPKIEYIDKKKIKLFPQDKPHALFPKKKEIPSEVLGASKKQIRADVTPNLPMSMRKKDSQATRREITKTVICSIHTVRGPRMPCCFNFGG